MHHATNREELSTCCHDNGRFLEGNPWLLMLIREEREASVYIQKYIDGQSWKAKFGDSSGVAAVCRNDSFFGYTCHQNIYGWVNGGKRIVSFWIVFWGSRFTRNFSASHSKQTHMNSKCTCILSSQGNTIIWICYTTTVIQHTYNYLALLQYVLLLVLAALVLKPHSDHARRKAGHFHHLLFH